MDIYVIVWAAILVFLLIVEATTVNLTTIWFAAGALIALLLAVFDVPLWIQITVFVVVSVACVFATRPLVKKMNAKKVRTNADKVFDQIGVVTKDIKPLEIGEVVMETTPWRAVSDEEINVGEKVKVLEISGTKLKVEKLKEEDK